MRMDAIWARPQECVCVCVGLCRFAWHWSDRFPDFMTPILWWSALTACVLPPVLSGAVAILGSRILSSTLLNHPLFSWDGVCARVFVHLCIRGAPWGEAGQSLPVAALGQGMAIQDTCLGSQPNLMVASLCLPRTSYSYVPPVHTGTCWPPFNPTVPGSPLLFIWFYCMSPFFGAICLSASLSCFLSLSASPSLFLSLHSVFWRGCISSLAVLFGGGGWERVGGSGGESQGTSEYINSHQKANRAEWRLGALSCEWHWAAVWVYHHSITARMSSGITHTQSCIHTHTHNTRVHAAADSTVNKQTHSLIRTLTIMLLQRVIDRWNVIRVFLRSFSRFSLPCL